MKYLLCKNLKPDPNVIQVFFVPVFALHACTVPYTIISFGTCPPAREARPPSCRECLLTHQTSAESETINFKVSAQKLQMSVTSNDDWIDI